MRVLALSREGCSLPAGGFPINKPNFDPRQRVFAGPRVNERIRVPEVRVIGPEGEMLGMAFFKSLVKHHGKTYFEGRPGGPAPLAHPAWSKKKGRADARPKFREETPTGA